MKISKAIEVVAALLTGALGLLIYGYLLSQDVATYRNLGRPVRVSLEHVLAFIVVAAPGLLVTISAGIHAWTERDRALQAVWVTVTLACALLLFYGFGFALVFNQNPVGLIAVVTQCVMAIVTLLAARRAAVGQ